MDPDHQHRKINRKDPKHKDEDRMAVVVEVQVGGRTLYRISIWEQHKVGVNIDMYRFS